MLRAHVPILATALLLAALAAAPLPAAAQETLLDWPVGVSNGTQVVKGHGFYVMQRYANHNDCVDHDNGVWTVVETQTTDCQNPPCYFCNRFYGGEATLEGLGYRVHAGIDLAREGGGSVGQPVFAAADGTVDCAISKSSSFNYPAGVIVISHDDGDFYTMYGHVDQIAVSEGDPVTRGQQIAAIADQTESLPHLHFEVRSFDENGHEQCAGDGYSQVGVADPGTEGYFDPAVQYYDPAHRPDLPITLTINEDGLEIYASPSQDAEVLTTADDGMRLPATALADDDDGSPGVYWYRVRYDQANLGYVAAYDAGVGWSGDLAANEQDRRPYPSPAGCACTWGADANASPIPTANTFCAFDVCGADLQFYRCESWGWRALGQPPTGPCSMPVPNPGDCTCYQGVYYGGAAIDPADTFCGMRVCGADDQWYRCESGGWVFEGGGPCH